jgi:hypothetical protein
MDKGKKIDSGEAEKSKKLNWIQLLIALLILGILIIQLFFI